MIVRKDERLAHERIQSAFRDFGAAIEQYGGGVNEILGDAADAFWLQDRITALIVSALAVNLLSNEKEALASAETDVPAAHDAFLND